MELKCVIAAEVLCFGNTFNRTAYGIEIVLAQKNNPVRFTF